MCHSFTPRTAPRKTLQAMLVYGQFVFREYTQVLKAIVAGES
ncbi:hypothetical protein [Phormidesmis sp. 146-12]